MKLGRIVNALPTLQKLADENFSIKTLYKISKLLQRLEKEISFFNSERNKIIKELCEKEDDTKFKIPEKNKEEVNRRLQELGDLDVDLDIKPIQLDINENVRLSYVDLVVLEGMVELYDPNESQ